MTTIPPQQSAPVTAPPVTLPQGSPQQVLRAMRAQRDELGDQMQRLQEQRSNLTAQMERTSQSNAARKGLEQQLAQVDGRIAQVQAQIAASDQLVAQAAAIPGSTTVPIPRPPDMPDPDMLAGMLFVLALAFVIPMSVAFARRIFRKSAPPPAPAPEMLDRMAAIERAVDAVALEVERIGESQRFLTQAMATRGDAPALGAPKREALPVEHGR